LSKYSTISLPISECSDVDYINKHSELYSNAFRSMYHRIEESSDDNVVNHYKKRYNLTDIGYRSLVTDVKASISSMEESKKIKLKNIEVIEKEIQYLTKRVNELEDKKDKNYYKLKQNRYKLYKKLDKNKSTLNIDIVFGGRKLLKDISYLSNRYNKDKDQETKDRIEKLKIEYNDKRTNKGIYLIGEANRKGNRFFDFDLPNNSIIYRPTRKNKIVIKFNYRNKKLLEKLQILMNNKIIPITVIVKSNEILLSYDNEILSGYSFNKKEVNRKVKEFKNKNKNLTKDEISIEAKKIYKEEHDNLKERKLLNKIENRCIAIDLNPENIGYSVVELKKDNTIKIIEKKSFDIKPLTKKLGKSSDSIEQIYQNNKREFELKENIINLFRIAKHYKCYKFCMENLSFRDEASFFSKEFNRKIRNIWNLGLIKRMINKYIALEGMELVEVEPYYTSFIGNVMYEYCDPVNASIEIARRGLTKYIKGMFYPIITEEVLNTAIAYLGIDVSLRDSLCNWVKLYQASEESRWRRGIDSNLLSVTSRNNTRKKVIIYSY